MQERLPLPRVALHRLLAVEGVDLGAAPVLLRPLRAEP